MSEFWQSKYIVFTKKIDEPWPQDDPLIKFHRSEYDAGAVEMLWWRDGDYLHWLRIPRKVKAPRRYYFSRGPSKNPERSEHPYINRVQKVKR